jgi:hypothetical protein
MQMHFCGIWMWYWVNYLFDESYTITFATGMAGAMPVFFGGIGDTFVNTNGFTKE